jgi:hypothetical protein
MNYSVQTPAKTYSSARQNNSDNTKPKLFTDNAHIIKTTTFIISIIYDAFNDAVSSSDYTASNDRMINEEWI